MRKFSAIVVGGGASGIAAAISAKRKGASVIICERMPRLGKKVMASGNGRCNLSNDDLTEAHYNQSSRKLVREVFKRFGKQDILDFFIKLGLKIYSDNGRVFPVTNQASSVLRILEIELKRLGIPILYNFDVSDLSFSEGSFIIKSGSAEKIFSDSVIIACGGNSYSALGSNGSGYALAARFGHKIVKPVPVAVPLLVKDPACHLLQGQRISAVVMALVDHETVSEAAGDLLFTKYGISGTSVLDVSEELSISLNRDRVRDVEVTIDMAPFIEFDDLKNELDGRIRNGFSCEDMLVGILPNKFNLAFKNVLDSKDAGRICNEIKRKTFKVAGTRGWNEAEFTAGGVDTNDVASNLESKLRKGVYFAGEVLDVNGKRGGYNLAWAWASGMAAGLRD